MFLALTAFSLLHLFSVEEFCGANGESTNLLNDMEVEREMLASKFAIAQTQTLVVQNVLLSRQT